MRSSYIALTIIGVMGLSLPACVGIGEGKDKKETEQVKMTERTVTVQPSSGDSTDKPIRVILMDPQTQKGMWYIDTTRAHVEFLQDTGQIRVDGQLWTGPYKIVSR